MSDKPPSNAAVFEQVYTSARALLNRSHGDLGVVCETAGFPKEIQPELDRLNSYQTLESLPAIPLSDIRQHIHFRCEVPKELNYTFPEQSLLGGPHWTNESTRSSFRNPGKCNSKRFVTS